MKILLGIIAVFCVVLGTILSAFDLLAIGIFIPLIYKHFEK